MTCLLRFCLPVLILSFSLATFASMSEAYVINHRRPVFFSQFSPNGRYLMTAAENESVRVYETASGGLIWSYNTTEGFVGSPSWSADSRKVLIPEKFSVSLLRVANGQVLHKVAGIEIQNAALSPDSEYIFMIVKLASRSYWAHLYEMKSEQVVFREKVMGQLTSVFDITFSANSDYIVLQPTQCPYHFYNHPCLFQLFSLKGNLFFYLAAKERMESTHISPNGKYLLVGTDQGETRILKIPTLQTMKVFKGAEVGPYNSLRDRHRAFHRRRMKGYAWSPDSRFVVTDIAVTDIAVTDPALTNIALTEVATKTSAQPVLLRGAVVDTETGDVVLGRHRGDEHRGHEHFAFAPNGKHLLSAGGPPGWEISKRASVRELQTGKVVASFKSPRPIRAVDWSSDGQYLLLNFAYSVTVFEINYGKNRL